MRLLRPVLLVLLLAVVLPACGKYQRSNADRTPESTQPEAVGSGIDEATGATTTTTVPRRGGSSGGTPRPTVLSPDTTLPANVSEITTLEGLRLTLTVDGKLKYGAGDDIVLQLVVFNGSKQAVEYDPNDLRNFALRPPRSSTVSWSDGNCRSARVPKAVETRAQVLNPNEETKFVDRYPGPEENANRDDCRVPAGTYVAFGFITLCPPGSTDSRGVCDQGKTKQVSSGGVQLTIG